MAVDYKLCSPAPIGAPPINVTSDTTQRIPLGTIVKARDASSADFGEAEFEYVKFTGTVARGELCQKNKYAKTCIVVPAAATKGWFGIAMAAQVSGNYGYVMVKGIDDAASVLTGAVAGVAPIYGSALTAGRITDAVTANFILEGVAIRLTGTANVGAVELNYPSCTGR